MQVNINEHLLADFRNQQLELCGRIELVDRLRLEDIHIVTGIDLAHFQLKGKDYATCCAYTVDYHNHEVIETNMVHSEITLPYIAGYLSFRELGLIKDVIGILKYKPDLLMFDGNGYLHPRHMGIATHASIIFDIPSIGVAKSYHKISDALYEAPTQRKGDYTDIVIDNITYGRALVTRDSCKPIFVSCGNFITLDTATKVVLDLCEDDSKLPIPVRMADINSYVERDKMLNEV